MCVCVCVCVCARACTCSVAVLSHAQLFATLWTVALQAPLFMEFSRQEYWNGLSFPLPGVLPNPRIKTASPSSPVLQADSLPLSHQGSHIHIHIHIYIHKHICYAMLSHFSRVRLCNPIDSSPPGFPVPGILQARTLEWAAISFSNA